MLMYFFVINAIRLRRSINYCIFMLCALRSRQAFSVNILFFWVIGGIFHFLHITAL